MRSCEGVGKAVLVVFVYSPNHLEARAPGLVESTGCIQDGLNGFRSQFVGWFLHKTGHSSFTFDERYISKWHADIDCSTRMVHALAQAESA